MSKADGKPTLPVLKAMMEISEMAYRLGMKNIKDLPGCWEYQIDVHWWIAVNGHAESMPCSDGSTIPPFHTYIEYNGWPAGLISPFDGVIASGNGANEDAFIRACQKVMP